MIKQNPITDDFFRDVFRKAVLGDWSYFYSQTLIGGLQSGLLVASAPRTNVRGLLILK